MKNLFTSVVLMLMFGVSLIFISVAQADHHEKMDATADQAEMIEFTPSDIVWGDVPPLLPSGAKIVVLEGDPNNPGPYSLRLMMPEGYKIPAHWHKLLERVTVLSGTLNVGMGDKLDVSQGKKLPAGSFIVIPPNMNHFAWADEETVIQISGDGPFDITYINPADDPRNKN